MPYHRSLCDTFSYRAIATWNYMYFGSQTRIKPSEESLTDINLLEIQARHTKEVRTWKFPRINEARKSGADWEWWFGSPNQWVGVRIQAKKLDIRSGRYAGLNRKNKYGRWR